MIKSYFLNIILAAVFFSFISISPSDARTIYAISTTGGNWNATGNWSLLGIGGLSCNCTPLTTDDVKIPGGYSIAIPSSLNAECSSLEMNGNLITIGNGALLQLTNTSSLTVNGDLTMNGSEILALLGSAIHSININGGSIVVNGDLLMVGNKSLTKKHDHIIDIGTNGSLTVTGNVEMQNDGASVEIRSNYTGSVINVGGNFSFEDSGCDIKNGSGANGTINYNGSSAQSVIVGTGAGSLSYYNLKISNSGTKTPLGNVVINNNLTISDNAVLNGGTNSVGAGGASLTMSGGEFKIARGTQVPELTGTYTLSGGRITLNGSVAQSLRSAVYNEINFDNTFSTCPQISVNGNITVNAETILTQGCIDLGNFNFTLENNAVITGCAPVGSTSNRYFITSGTGKLVQNNIGPAGRSAGVLFPVGYSSSSYTPVIIENTGTTDNFGVNISNNVYLIPPATGLLTAGFINKTINVSEGTTGGSNVSMTIQWNSSDEMTGFNRGFCSILHYDGTWGSTQSGDIAINSGPYLRTTSGITSFSPFTVQSSDVLPIQLLSFDVFQNEGNIDLIWKTGVEIDNDYFSVERSKDGRIYEEILKMKGAGNSSQTVAYTATDNNPLTGRSYYRIRQTDKDGKFSYSPVKSILAELISVEEFKVFPNPSNGSEVNISLSSVEKNEEVLVIVYDAYGRLTYSKVIPKGKGNVFTAIDPGERLKPGVYYVVGSKKDEFYKQKLVIK